MSAFTRRLAIALPALFIGAALHAAPTLPPVRAEIEALLDRLQASGCEFNRNGTWYSGADARAHLLRKLEAIESRTAVHSTEQFIEAGASTSSTSGQPYQVRCGGAAPVPSRQWLSTQLAALRAGGRP
jgi:hypothetical protein